MLVPDGAKAGKISKPYGLKGELVIILEPLVWNDIKPDNPLFIEIDGQRVPFFVKEVELLSKEQAIIKFEFIDTLEAAREVSGSSIFFETGSQSDSVKRGEGELAGLIGFAASDIKSGPLGLISDYLPHPMNPVFVIQSENRELLVPAVMDFIEQINIRERSIQFILPEGLTTL
ncbi:MAG: ribosome maturation factor RimM [Bacteroidales bacterium]|nr:ribosome maturation factor RimM [Bacteroidales bacterium]